MTEFSEPRGHRARDLAQQRHPVREHDVDALA